MPLGRSIPLTYATAVTGLLFLQHAFDSYLSQRQLSRLHHRSLPTSLQSYFKLLRTSGNGIKAEDDEQKITSNFLASQEYSKDKLRLSQIAQLVDLIENCLYYTPFLTTFILTGYYARPVSGLKVLWDYSTSFDLVKGRGEIVQSLAFVTAVNLLSKITSVPMSLYKPFVLEAEVGIKSFLISLCEFTFRLTYISSVNPAARLQQDDHRYMGIRFYQVRTLIDLSRLSLDSAPPQDDPMGRPILRHIYNAPYLGNSTGHGPGLSLLAGSHIQQL